ncbi:MAG TPA: M48 family metallopeptidase [Spirochaetota bacterium]|nr:M48 family metallopeptidase [Spirochaetota bacterium]
MENELKEKTYNRIKIRLNIAGMVIDLGLLVILAFSGLAVLIASLSAVTGNDYINFLVFVFLCGLLFSAISIPMDFYGGYVVEHRFGLSNQSLLNWVKENLKSTALNIVIGVPVALAFYWFIRSTGNLWWLWFGIFVFVLSVVLARIAPVLIFPIFYKFKELDNGEIKERVEKILADVNIKISGIFSFNMSKDTKKANAGFTGLGKTKRIILSDTLLENFSVDEIAVVFAHEAGHYKYRHIVKNIMFSTVIIFVSFYLCGQSYAWTVSKMGFVQIHEFAALPVLMLYLSIFGLLLMPVTNSISRRYEYQADAYALQTTGNLEAFVSTMEKLAAINLSDKEPNRVVEFFFYSHPSIKRRVEAARASFGAVNG